MKYRVTINRSCYYDKEVEADSYEDAIHTVYEELSYGFDDFELVDETIEVDEVKER